MEETQPGGILPRRTKMFKLVKKLHPCAPVLRFVIFLRVKIRMPVKDESFSLEIEQVMANFQHQGEAKYQNSKTLES